MTEEALNESAAGIFSPPVDSPQPPLAADSLGVYCHGVLTPVVDGVCGCGERLDWLVTR